MGHDSLVELRRKCELVIKLLQHAPSLNLALLILWMLKNISAVFSIIIFKVTLKKSKLLASKLLCCSKITCIVCPWVRELSLR